MKWSIKSNRWHSCWNHTLTLIEQICGYQLLKFSWNHYFCWNKWANLLMLAFSRIQSITAFSNEFSSNELFLNTQLKVQLFAIHSDIWVYRRCCYKSSISSIFNFLMNNRFKWKAILVKWIVKWVKIISLVLYFTLKFMKLANGYLLWSSFQTFRISKLNLHRNRCVVIHLQNRHSNWLPFTEHSNVANEISCKMAVFKYCALIFG